MKRPLGFSHVEARFHAALAQKKLHHAWLFHGLSGIGKSMLAKALAADCLCLNPNLHGTACYRCHACLMLEQGAHPDYLGVSRLWDSKKKREKRDITVQQVRELLDFLSLSSFDHGYRVVLIDCLDDLNHQASNALLKGLEEPSAGGVLLLVCHDVHHAMPTIRSRCLLQACPPLNQEDCSNVLGTFCLPEALLPHATVWANGRVGGIDVLSSPEAGSAALTLHHSVSKLPRCDLAELQETLQSAVSHIPHPLIARIVFMALRVQTATSVKSWKNKTITLNALQGILRWPNDVHRHTLRPVPTLFDRMMQLRIALRKA
ncbi:MAG: AAA family ATPase [Mariprofundaceae bacterium]|nr:AAA family ATPase [Mariprofundaceae bacterium]